MLMPASDRLVTGLHLLQDPIPWSGSKLAERGRRSRRQLDANSADNLRCTRVVKLS